MPNKTYIAALSGGVDSSVAAALALEAGHQVIGVTLALHEPIGNSLPGCADDAGEAAARVAEKLGIPHRILDMKKAFSDLILAYSWDEYSQARTPNPCVKCNETIKFGALLDYALNNGADGILTGHHARIHQADDGRYCIRRGTDDTKNQAYFLCRLTQEQLSRIWFPIGHMTKAHVREKARELDLPSAESPDSQDACFSIKGQSFPETLRTFFGEKFRKGYFVDESGNRIAKHKGLHLYTIGQRKGLDIALGKPAYVKSINPETGDVVVTTNPASLMATDMNVSDINWQLGGFKGTTFSCDVQIRYRSAAVKATVSAQSPDATHIVFETPQRAVTPGQTAVFYQDDLVIGGGWITQAYSSNCSDQES